MKIYIVRIILLLFATFVNYTIWSINDEFEGTGAALGAAYYIMIYFGIMVIFAVVVAALTKFRNFQKFDYFLFVLCTPTAPILILLIS